jgi:rRNA maturation endonuclease Nob1
LYDNLGPAYFDVVAASEGRPAWSHELICWNCGSQYRGAVDNCPHCDGYGQ